MVYTVTVMHGHGHCYSHAAHVVDSGYDLASVHACTHVSHTDFALVCVRARVTRLADEVTSRVTDATVPQSIRLLG